MSSSRGVVGVDPSALPSRRPAAAALATSSSSRPTGLGGRDCRVSYLSIAAAKTSDARVYTFSAANERGRVDFDVRLEVVTNLAIRQCQ